MNKVDIFCECLLHSMRAHNQGLDTPSACTHFCRRTACGCIHPNLHWHHGSNLVANPMSQDCNLSANLRLLGAFTLAGSVETKVYRPGQVVQSRYSGIDGNGHCDPSDTTTGGLLIEFFDLEESQNIPFAYYRGRGSWNNHIQRSGGIRGKEVRRQNVRVGRLVFTDVRCQFFLLSMHASAD